MISKLFKCTALGIGLSLGLTLFSPIYPASITWASAQQPLRHQVSPDIPLQSYVYDYLDKLDGLGYLKDMQTGTKPYTRLQVAQWVEQISAMAKEQPAMPKYVESMLNQLQVDFQQELDFLNGSKLKHSLAVKEITLTETYYDGDTLSQHRTRSTYQPLNINNDRNRFSQNLNHEISMRVEGTLNDHLVVSATPKFTYGTDTHSDTQLAAGYIKTNINNVEFQLGKKPVWWGPGNRGGLLLTNNAQPQTGITIGNIDPVTHNGLLKFLGPTNVTVIYSEMEKDRQDVKSPSFFASRADFTPSKNFTFAWSLASIVGGEGKSLSGRDYLDFITGKNAETAAQDKWNSIAGFDFRWRMPQLGGIQFYGELYGEDQAMAVIIPTPSKVAETLGIYIPRVSADGSWDARLEYAHTTNVWYSHSAYTDGYTYKGNILGDAMGHDANRYYAKLTHYNDNGSSLSLNLENVTQHLSAPSPQKISAAWLATKINLDTNTFLNASAGVAQIKNKGYQAGVSDKNYLVGVSLTKLF
ncbi:capsule assembly Wzi family protein [Sporomusa sp.]|uniref:capsule assembly Wzi family protein n=1 Tax=Sporomusa sp. TaxID=2078658 RepID=UPI002CDBD187|nr:capsule assembly Wzi family protein [Sporomusa sp.]HWR45819.1 capsule assembly Wzi family protein [Sporomusa sp.]